MIEVMQGATALPPSTMPSEIHSSVATATSFLMNAVPHACRAAKAFFEGEEPKAWRAPIAQRSKPRPIRGWRTSASRELYTFPRVLDIWRRGESQVHALRAGTCPERSRREPLTKAAFFSWLQRFS